MTRSLIRGFTILEITLAIAIFTAVIGMVGRFYIDSQNQNYRAERLTVALQTWMRAGEQLQFDLKSATRVTSSNPSSLELETVVISQDLFLKAERVTWRQEGENSITRESGGKITRYDFSDGLERKQKLALDFSISQ